MDIEKIILDCIKLVLRNEGYSEESIKTAINWNYAEIKDFLEREVN